MDATAGKGEVIFKKDTGEEEGENETKAAEAAAVETTFF